MKIAIIVTLLLCAPAATAEQRPRPCRANDVPCDPPATFVYEKAPVPFNAPVQFGGATVEQGRIVWTWIKAGEPPRACTAEESSNGPAYERACAARIGEVLFRNVAFVMDEVPQ